MKLIALKSFSAGGRKLIRQGEVFDAPKDRAEEYIRLKLASTEITKDPTELREALENEEPDLGTPISDYKEEELKDMTVSKLKEIAKNIGVTGYSGFTKSELIFSILAQQNYNNTTEG